MLCIALRTGERDDGVKQAIPTKLIALAKAGERNPDILCEEVLKDIRGPNSEREQAGAFLQPSHKCVGCSRGAFVALRALYPVQNFVALVESWSRLLLASKADPVIEVADDAP